MVRTRAVTFPPIMRKINSPKPNTFEEAVTILRRQEKYKALVRDAYYDADALLAAERFAVSSEFREVLNLIGSVEGKVILDVGAGRGIASYAFSKSGAKHVHALEPSTGPLVGQQAIKSLNLGDAVTVHGTGAEAIPLEDSSVDVIYVRQALHHIPDLDRAFCEFRRVLRASGIVIACREHVAESRRELIAFRRHHPLHRMIGGENALPVQTYVAAFEKVGFNAPKVLGPWESIINAYPVLQSSEELEEPIVAIVSKRLGVQFTKLLKWRFVSMFATFVVCRPRPGRLYTFLWRA